MKTYKEFLDETTLDEGTRKHHKTIVAYDKETKEPLDIYSSSPNDGGDYGIWRKGQKQLGFKTLKKWGRIMYPDKKRIGMKKNKTYVEEGRTSRGYYVWGNKKRTKTGVIRKTELDKTDRQDYPVIDKSKRKGTKFKKSGV